MKTKIVNNARFTPKGDIEANWNRATGFIPLEKEIIIYKPDDDHPASRIKVGDGVTPVNELPFIGSSDDESIKELMNDIANEKFDKTGGIISGDLAVQGNLSVSGENTVLDTVTLQVQNNSIVVNSGGEDIIDNAGFVVRVDDAEAYGMMYDPVGDGVKIGIGGFTEDGKFAYNEGQAQFLATRDDTIEDGNIPQWDNEKKKFVDSGESLTDYVKNTDYISSNKAGILADSSYYGFRAITDKGVVGGISRALDKYNTDSPYYFISKGTLENIKYEYIKQGITTNTETWTDDEMQSARDLIGAVGEEDYAGSSKAGVGKVSSVYGTGCLPSGYFYLIKASNSEIDSKEQLYKPIVPSNLDYAVLRAIAYNALTPTEDEQKSARDLIGAVGIKDYAGNGVKGIVDVRAFFGLVTDQYARIQIVKATNAEIDEKTNEYHPIVPKILDYATMKALSDCKDTTLWTDDTTDENGEVVQGTKTKARELLGAVKQIQYVSGNTSTITGTDSGIAGRAYVRDFSNKDNSIAISPQGKSNTLALRDANGNMQVADPKLDYHCVNRRYVNNLPDNLTLTDDEQAKWRGMIGATKLYLHEVATPSGKIAIVNKYSVQYATVDDLLNNVWGQSTDLSTHFPVSSKLLNFSPDEPVLPLVHVRDHGTSITLFSIDSQSADDGRYNGFISYRIEKTAEITDTVTAL